MADKEPIRVNVKDNHEFQSYQRHANEHFWALNWADLKGKSFFHFFLNRNGGLGHIISPRIDWFWRNFNPFHQYYATRNVDIEVVADDVPSATKEKEAASAPAPHDADADAADLRSVASASGGDRSFTLREDGGIDNGRARITSKTPFSSYENTVQRRLLDKKGRYLLRGHSFGDIWAPKSETSVYYTFAGMFNFGSWGTYAKTGYYSRYGGDLLHNVAKRKDRDFLESHDDLKPYNDDYAENAGTDYIAFIPRAIWYALYKAGPSALVLRTLWGLARTSGHVVKSTIRDSIHLAWWLLRAIAKVGVALPLLPVAGIVAFLNARILDQRTAPAEKTFGRVMDWIFWGLDNITGESINNVNSTVVKALTSLWRKIDLENPVPYLQGPAAFLIATAISYGVSWGLFFSPITVPAVSISLFGLATISISSYIMTNLAWYAVGVAVTRIAEPILSTTFEVVAQISRKLSLNLSSSPFGLLNRAYEKIKYSQAILGRARGIKDWARKTFGRQRFPGADEDDLIIEHIKLGEMDYRTKLKAGEGSRYPDEMRELIRGVNAGTRLISPLNQGALETVMNTVATGQVRVDTTKAILGFIVEQPERDFDLHTSAARTTASVYRTQNQRKTVRAKETFVPGPATVENGKTIAELFSAGPENNGVKTRFMTRVQYGATLFARGSHITDDRVLRKQAAEKVEMVIKPEKSRPAIHVARVA